MYIHICIHMCIHIYMYIYILYCIYIYNCVCVYIYIYTYTYICIYDEKLNIYQYITIYRYPPQQAGYPPQQPGYIFFLFISNIFPYYFKYITYYLLLLCFWIAYLEYVILLNSHYLALIFQIYHLLTERLYTKKKNPHYPNIYTKKKTHCPNISNISLAYRKIILRAKVSILFFLGYPLQQPMYPQQQPMLMPPPQEQGGEEEAIVFCFLFQKSLYIVSLYNVNWAGH